MQFPKLKAIDRKGIKNDHFYKEFIVNEDWMDDSYYKNLKKIEPT